MRNPKHTFRFADRPCSRPRHGFVLLLTIVVLVVLVTICCTMSARLGALKRRQRYMIDYQQSRYACDSAMKYILDNVSKVQLKLIDREEEPDFSDLFIMDRTEYEQFQAEWALIMAEKAAQDKSDTEGGAFSAEDFYIDPNTITVPGPYGPEWPLVQEPVELEIGNSLVTITIEDENAKMPLTWAITTNNEANLKAMGALATFCEWMQMGISEIEQLQTQAEAIGEYKQFQLSLQPISYTEKTQVTTTPGRTTSIRSVRGRTSRPTTSTRIVKKTRPAIAHATDFAKLLHSSLLDTERLSWAIPDTGDRHESPLKYMALWGSQRVNINTAPRHVLEAAFTFGGDAREIAHEIIQMRKTQPFKDIDELKTKLYGYNDSIRQAEPYLCTQSKFLSVKVKATTGAATVAAVATVVKEGNATQRVAILMN